MSVYIVNLGKHRESKAVGAWFYPPISFEDVAEKIGLNAEYEGYAIHDYELPFEIGEYTSIDEINHQCRLVRELEGTPIYDALPELLASGCFYGVENLAERQEDVHHWAGCEDMGAVACELVEKGYLEIPERLRNYIDYEAVGNTLETSGIFIHTRYGIFEVYC